MKTENDELPAAPQKRQIIRHSAQTVGKAIVWWPRIAIAAFQSKPLLPEPRVDAKLFDAGLIQRLCEIAVYWLNLLSYHLPLGRGFLALGGLLAALALPVVLLAGLLIGLEYVADSLSAFIAAVVKTVLWLLLLAAIVGVAYVAIPFFKWGRKQATKLTQD